jgi:hypothetical protein
MDDRCGRGPNDDDDDDSSNICDGGDKVFEGVVGVSFAVFRRDVVVGRRVESPRVRNVRLLDSPQATNASSSRIHQPRRPSTRIVVRFSPYRIYTN